MFAVRQISKRVIASSSSSTITKACAASLSTMVTSSSSSSTTITNAAAVVSYSKPIRFHTPATIQQTYNTTTIITPASRSFSTSLKNDYEYIIVEKRFPATNNDNDKTKTAIVGGGVGLITLHRPKALNALCDALFEDLIHAARALNEDEDIGCLVLTGSKKAFAAGELVFSFAE